MVNNLQKTINDCIDKSQKPNKYDSFKCIEFSKECKLKKVFEILELYYLYAIIIVYYIHYNTIVDKIMNNSELYNMYKKMKKEVHNENYIIEKLHPIYNSLYKTEYDITFDNEDEFKFLIETINSKENIVEKDDFIDINSSILNLDVNKFMNYINDDELGKVIDEIRNDIGLVPQKAVLFEGTIRSNLLWGKKDV